jgi:CrcB protein
MRILWIGLGGCIGSIGRYLMTAQVRRLPVLAPVGTLAVNVAGCFAIGVLSVLAERDPQFTPDVRAFVFVGLLGGFTTFSAFGSETVELLQTNRVGAALLNVAAHLVLGLGAVWVGRAVTAYVA